MRQAWKRVGMATEIWIHLVKAEQGMSLIPLTRTRKIITPVWRIQCKRGKISGRWWRKSPKGEESNVIRSHDNQTASFLVPRPLPPSAPFREQGINAIVTQHSEL